MMGSIFSGVAGLAGALANAFRFVEVLVVAGIVAGIVGIAIVGLTNRRSFALRASLLQSIAVLLLAVSIAPMIPRTAIPKVAQVSTSAIPWVPDRVVARVSAISDQGVATTRSNRAARGVVVVLVAVWLVGAIAFLMRLARGVSLMSGIRRRAQRTGRARVLVSDEIDIPCAAGVFAPVVLVPRESESWEESEWRAILTHELAHIERHDVLMHWTRQLVLAIHWFNPAIHWLNEMTDDATEGACDDAVIIGGIERHTYASALISMASGIARQHPIQAAAFIGRKGIEMRIAALIDTRRARRRSHRSDRLIPASAGIVGVLSAMLVAPAQTAFAIAAPIVVAAQTLSTPKPVEPDTARELTKSRSVRKLTDKRSSLVDDYTEAVAGLASLMSDTNPIVRQSATDALRSWGEVGKSILRSLAADADAERASAARAALAVVGESR